MLDISKGGRKRKRTTCGIFGLREKKILDSLPTILAFPNYHTNIPNHHTSVPTGTILAFPNYHTNIPTTTIPAFPRVF